MNKIYMPLCLNHQQPIAEITLIQSPEDELQLLCSKCPKPLDSSIEIVQILDHLSKLQISGQQSDEAYLNFLLNRIQSIKHEFLQVIENFSKQVKDQIKFFKQQIITPQTINYYSTIQQMKSEDLKQLSLLFALNFQMDHSFQYHKTNKKLHQQLTILHYKIKQANQLKNQIDNLFNPDYQIQSQVQTDEEDCFNDNPIGYKNYIEKDKIKYSQQIRGIEFSANNQYVFAFSHELPLTAFKIINNKLTVYQKLEQKSQNIFTISSSKMINRIYAGSDNMIDVYEENQQKLWKHTKQFQMKPYIRLIKVSIDEKIAITQMRNVTLFYPNQENEDKKQIQLPEKHKKNLSDISFNFNGSFLISASEDIMIIWKISNHNQIEMYQYFENQSMTYAQFSDSEENIICTVNRFGNRQFWKSDSKGFYYEAQTIYESSSSFACAIKFRLNSKLVILGNHSIQLLENDSQNDNEWKVQQQFKVNCWNLDVSKDGKHIVADDFSNLCLFVREE